MKKLLSFILGMVAWAGTSVAQQPENTIQRETNIFAIKGKDTLLIDTYIDSKAKVESEGRPVIIYIHGGGFVTGSRINAAQEIFCRHMAEQGFLAASVDYRLAGIQYQDPEHVINPYNVNSVLESVTMACDDVVDATNFILNKKEWKANAAKVSVGGGSAGAVASLTLVYDVCNNADYTKKLPKDFAYAGVISQAGAVGTLAEETTWAKKPCPIMFFHGSIDELVPLEKSKIAETNFMGTEYLTRQLKDMDVPHWTWIEKGADHVMAMKPLTSYLEEQTYFLKEFVVKGNKSSVRTDWADKEPAAMQSVDMMLKYVPMYILGFGKYLEDMDFNNIERPKNIVF